MDIELRHFVNISDNADIVETTEYETFEEVINAWGSERCVLHNDKLYVFDEVTKDRILQFSKHKYKKGKLI